jgi:cystathionine beta-lyase
MVSKKTAISQIGIFPIGALYIPTTPAINATTLIARRSSDLSSINKNSLCETQGGVYDNLYYGGVSTPTTVNLEKTISKLEGGDFSILTPSGQSAIVAVLSAMLKEGDHFLVVDTVTYTTRWFIDQFATKTGVSVTYYEPTASQNIKDYFTNRTRIVFMESPGSFTYEVQAVPEICAEASRQGVLTVLDNTWAASLFFSPFIHGVDISILSLTKCHVGPSGVSLGAIVTKSQELYKDVRNQVALLGLSVSSDTCSRAMLSLPTLDLRLRQQEVSLQGVINFLRGVKGIKNVFHPSLSGASGHNLWRRDFSGSTPLFSVSFDDWADHEVAAIIDRLRVIKIGYGWGGSLSLVSEFKANEWRRVSNSTAEGLCLRFYIGLEDSDDLIADLEQAFNFVSQKREAQCFLGQFGATICQED